MIHVFHTPTGWKVCPEYPEEPTPACTKSVIDAMSCALATCQCDIDREHYTKAVALSIANAVDVREKDLHHLWNSNWFFNSQPHGHDYKDNEVYALPELEMRIETVETRVWFLEHIMSRAWVIQNNIAGFTWTNIPTEATQFSSSEEAQQYDDKSTQNGKELNAYPTEHIFYSKLAHVFRKKEEPKMKEKMKSRVDKINYKRVEEEAYWLAKQKSEELFIDAIRYLRFVKYLASKDIIVAPENQSPPPDIEESQDDLWTEVAYNFSMVREFKDAYKTLKSKFHLTRVKAELKGEKK